MDGGLDNFVAPGRHTRRPGRPGLRRVSLAALIMLVVQYGLGIFLNLYVAVPGASLAMAVLTGLALLCYVGTLALATAARRAAIA